MTTRVFIAGDGACADARVVLDPGESHYLRRVRRLGEGAEVEAIDDRGVIWRAEVEGGDARATRLRLLEPRPLPAPPPEIVVLLGLPEPAAVLDVLPGLCELGVAAIVLVRCARSQGVVPGGERIARVLRAAQRQCGRPTPPDVRGPVSLREAVALRTDLPGYFAWEALRGAETSSSDRTAGAPASTGARERAGARLCVGPEGGFVADEARLLQEAGFRPLGLGPYTLRTGTAALVGVARLLAP